ncbi:J domain-containing protein [Marinomonas sp. 15G1-11]|uniref:J domain-containing protein n=1 Tax=Marinomonas phaeophyticola TaxID=3004091 RepID=A0ABT4JRD0_9GAMM|nr:J domain-containing protein [Marinomonas sp. 15G1-11]MCZ2720378.1 J domain-containing protein [Marinomonas sp. 15G1-11]
MSLNDDYQLLELDHNANEAQAKAAYRRLAKRYHPDKNPHRDTTERFQRLQVAYQNVLNAIRQGIITKEWKSFDFDTHRYDKTRFNTVNDELQYAYIKERQKAYDELKRNSAKHEKARQNAIREARNTANEKRVKKMYEEAFKASQASESFKQYSNQSNATADQQVDDFIQQYQSAAMNETDQDKEHNNNTTSYGFATQERPGPKQQFSFSKITPLNTLFLALSYLSFFALGVFTTFYWQSINTNGMAPTEKAIAYLPGQYPQLRHGINYTLIPTALFPSPDLSANSTLTVPAGVDVIASQLTASDWVAIRYQETAGWVQAKNLGFGSIEHAQNTGCYGYPGIPPMHGEVFGEHKGSSRLRILNTLPIQSLLTFESYDGYPSFSVFLHSSQPYAANFIPQGQYRLVLQSGSLYHRGCNQFLFNQTSKVVMEDVQFTSAERSLTLAQ